ncbi:MAG: YciI family protein [Magnetovibrio sp.]|nr:YciI family protein [Magnetovibrio sp.]
MLFAIFCTDKPNHLSVRMDNRPAHVEHLKSQGDRLIFAGPTFADDNETMNGSLIVLEVENKTEADAFCAADPYAKAGLFDSVIIRPWNKVLG